MTTLPPRDAEHEELSWFARWATESGCPPPKLLFAAAEGTLPSDAGDAIRVHLERCPLCRELVAIGVGDVAGPTLEEAARIRTRVFRDVGSTQRRSTRYVVYAAAAAVTLVIGGFALFRLVGQNTPATGTATNTAAPANVPPQYVLALNKPVTELPPESLTLRSGSPDRYAAALERALEPYERGDYAEAVRRLETVARDYPSRPHPVYYLGVAKLLAGRTDAVADLERARKLADRGSSLQTDATWYLGISLERSGQRAPAAAALTELCGSPGPRKAQACEGARALNNR